MAQTSEPSEDVCLFPCEVWDHSRDLEGELLAGSNIQVGPHEIKLYYAKELADHLDPNDLGLRIWPGTHAMVHLLLKLAGDKGLQGKSVLDVGCGTGFVGLVASKLGATSVCLSDRPGKSLVLAQLNAEANGKTLPPKGKVEVKALSWGSGKVDEVEKDFEVLLLSEVLYVAQPSCVPWTLDDAELLSLAQLTKSKLTADGEAWVTYGNREAGGGEQFQRAVEAVGLHFEELPLEEIIPAEILHGATHALRRVRIFRLRHQ